jgi:hypothetical protein
MDGRTLPDVCRDDGMPAAETVRRWVLDDREGFAARYFRARRIGTAAMASQAFEIAAGALDAWTTRQGKGGGTEATPDREHIAHSLLRIEVRCWLLARFLPRIYRDRLDPSFKHDPAKRNRELKQGDSRTDRLCSKQSREASPKTRSTCRSARRTKRTAKRTFFH